ncbi:conjugal transfer protein TraO [Empedobacter sp. UBA7248]|uniref:conjugal transfer protein TraO n=1 Tax=Empedobacter sp. UBA7248 TaxID=1946448 RepID=UPI0025BAEF9E|nr:conjugal transfer protein TraO [Empedobacter sp. UBA7248]
MFRKYSLTVLILLTALFDVQAQRMIPKKKGIEIVYSQLSNTKIGNDYALNIGLIINRKNGNYQLWDIAYSHRYFIYNHHLIPHETYTAEGGYNFFLIGDSQRNISLNFALSAVVGYETINRGDKVLYDGSEILNEDNFLYGVGSRLSIETYLSDKLVLLLRGQMKLFWGTTLEQFRPSVGIGIRYNL